MMLKIQLGGKEMANVLETIKTRSSIRAYSDKKLTDEQIRTLLEAGLLAPTAANKQELHFTVVANDSDIVKEIQQDLNPSAQVPFHYGSSHLFVISGVDEFAWTNVDAGIAVENMHLAAKDMGLGSVIIGIIAGVMTGEKKAYYNEKLGIPEGYSYKVALVVGNPATTKAPHEYNFDKDVTIL